MGSPPIITELNVILWFFLALICKLFGFIVSHLRIVAGQARSVPAGHAKHGVLGPFHPCLSPLPELSRAEVLQGVTIVTGGNWTECECVGTAARAFEVFTLNGQVILCKVQEIKHGSSCND